VDDIATLLSLAGRTEGSLIASARRFNSEESDLREGGIVREQWGVCLEGEWIRVQDGAATLGS